MSASDRHGDVDPRLRAASDCTAPTDGELERLLAARPTNARDAARHAETTAPTWREVRRARLPEAPRRSRDPRARTWAARTEPGDHEVAAVVSAPPRPEIAAATAPSDHEVARWLAGPVPADARPATAPSDLEVQRLVARGAPEPAGPRWAPAAGGVGALALAAALLLAVLWVAAPPGYGTPDLAVGTTADLVSDTPIDLGPSIDLHPVRTPAAPAPRVRIARADAGGTVVDVLEGGTRFEVDPEGAHRTLEVRAGDVSVHVRGTVFTVEHSDGAVRVAVDRGRVEVRTAARQFSLGRGETWTSRTTAAVAIPPDPPSPPTTEPEPVPVPETAPAAPAPAPVQPAAEVEDPAEDADDAATDASPASEATPDDGAALAPLPLPPPPTVMPATADALEHLQALRERHRSNADPEALIRDLRAFIAEGADERLTPIARDLLLDVLRRAGDRQALSEALREALLVAPSPALHLERGELLRALGDCGAAHPHHVAASTDPGRVGTRALVGLAACEETSGRRRQARRLLQQALRRAEDPATEEAIQQRLRDL